MNQQSRRPHSRLQARLNQQSRHISPRVKTSSTKKPAEAGFLDAIVRALSDLGFELGQCVEQVGDKAVIGYLEDRCVFVLVDRNDHLGVFHAGQVLDRA